MYIAVIIDVFVVSLTKTQSDRIKYIWIEFSVLVKLFTYTWIQISKCHN